MAYSSDLEPDQLTALTSLDSGDVFVVGDISDASEVAKYITKANLLTDFADETQTLTNKTINLTSNTLSGTIAQFNAALSDGDFATGGGTVTGTSSGTNTGDQTSIVGISGTMAQFDTAVSDGNIVYQSQALGTPSSGTLTNCTGLPLSGVVDSTSEALGVGSLEVGHASDTTLTRVSAGLLAVEGINLLRTSDVDDTPVNGATTDPVSSNWAFDHAALASSDTVVGHVELATIAETNTGTDATRAVTPDGLAGSNLGIRYYPIALNGSTALTTSDKFYFRIPAALSGMNLVSVAATVGTGAAGSSSSGTPTFTVKNVTDNNQMLSTSLTVDVNEYTSATAATAAVINTSFDDVATDDLIEVACTTSGTGVTYTVITLGFQLP